MKTRGLTIIMPFYNTQKQTLMRCIKSITNSSSKDFELIIINDGSEDAELGKAIKGINDERIVYKEKRNGGVSSARNVGLDNSSKEYITFVDSDDEVEPNFIDRIIQEIELDPDIIIFDSFYRKNNKTRTFKLPNNINISIDNVISLLLCNRIPSAPWGKVYKKSIIKKENIRFDEEIRIGEDLLFLFEYLQKIHSLHIINDQLYLYKINSSSAMNNINNRYDVLKVLSRFINDSKNQKYTSDLKARYYYEYRNIPKSKRKGYKSIGLLSFIFNKYFRITTKIRTITRVS